MNIVKISNPSFHKFCNFSEELAVFGKSVGGMNFQFLLTLPASLQLLLDFYAPIYLPDLNFCLAKSMFCISADMVHK